MDFILFRALRLRKFKRIAITYDIWCKYYVNLTKRAALFSAPLVQGFRRASLRGFVPKLHLAAHGAACRSLWSLNYAKNVGRTDAEGPERIWAIEGLLATQTAEMGPANRHAVLDDHAGEGNYRRYVGLRECFFFSAVQPLTLPRQPAVEEVQRGAQVGAATTRYREQTRTRV
jgi:hypothetical protein